MGRSVWCVVVSLLFVGLIVPGAGAFTVTRTYEAAGTIASGPGSDHASAYRCFGGQETPADLGACTTYLPAGLDLRGSTLVVTVRDMLYGDDVWMVVVVDLDGNTESDCAVDLCVSGTGSVTTQIPIDAGGRFVRAYPAAVHMTDMVCCPDGNHATRGEVTFDFI